MENYFLTPEQAAVMLNLSTYTIRFYARQGIIPAHKVGRGWRFSREDLLKWVEARGHSTWQPSDHLMVRDRSAIMSADSTAGLADSRDFSSKQVAKRQEAVETLRAVRSRARKGDVSALLRESRRELLGRRNDGNDPE